MNDGSNAGGALVQRITDEADAKAKNLIADAENYCKEAIDSAKTAGEKIITDSVARANAAAESIINNKRTLSAIETRKDALSVRREIVESVYEGAKGLLLKMKKTDYLAFLNVLVSKYAEKGDTVVISEKAPVSEEEVKSLKGVSALSLPVKKTGKFDGGIVLAGEKFDKDLTFSAIVESVKETTETEIAEKLFGR